MAPNPTIKLLQCFNIPYLVETSPILHDSLLQSFLDHHSK